MKSEEIRQGVDRLALHMTMSRNIHRTIEAAKASGQYVQIDQTLPSVFIYRGPDDEFFYQEHEAERVLAEAQRLADEFGLWASDALLYQAQEW